VARRVEEKRRAEGEAAHGEKKHRGGMTYDVS
jgi:hypothetical protein